VEAKKRALCELLLREPRLRRPAAAHGATPVETLFGVLLGVHAPDHAPFCGRAFALAMRSER
jgi:hypothetical protein